MIFLSIKTHLIKIIHILSALRRLKGDICHFGLACDERIDARTASSVRNGCDFVKIIMYFACCRF